jgi:glycosyltransferase involved in cell wall biosynthesis
MRRVAIFRSDLLRISETFIYEQARALTAWKPLLLGLREVKGGLDTPDVQRVVVSSGLFRFLNPLRFWFGFPLPALVRAIKELNVELVHVHFGTEATDIWPSVKLTGLPMVVTLHGYDINIFREWWESGKGGLRRRTYPRRLLQMAEDPNVSFIAVSEAIRRRAIEYGIASAKVTVVYIGVDTERFKPSGCPVELRVKRVLFVGRMVPKKAPILLVQAFVLVYKKVLDAELVMIGDGPLRQRTELVAKELGVPVRFLGARNADEIRAELRESRALCLPSITADNGDAEGFGLVILEAQACGVPVVSSALGGADEGLLDGETGFKFSESCVEDLARHLVSLLVDDNMARAFSVRGRDFILKKFDIGRTVDRMQKVYLSILSKD